VNVPLVIALLLLAAIAVATLVLVIEVLARVAALEVDADRVERVVDQKLFDRARMAHPAGDDR
jgi:hypothetical protein